MRTTRLVPFVALFALAVPSAQALGPTFCYRVSAVNAAGEGPLSNEICTSVPTQPLIDFQRFISDMQAASYYKKWVAASPGDAARWATFRDGVLTGGTPPIPQMTSKYGAGLVDAGVTAVDG